MPAPAPLATQPGPALGSAPIAPSERMPVRPRHSTLAPDRATKHKQSPLSAHRHPLSQHSQRAVCYKNSPHTARTSTESDQSSQHTRPASHPLQKHATAPQPALPTRPPEAGLQASPPHRNPRQGRLSRLVTKGATPQYSRSHGQPKRSTPQHTTLAAHVIAFLQMTSPDCATCCVTPRLVATCYFPAAPRPIKSI